jgi:polysaccharide biosynthesis/export protein
MLGQCRSKLLAAIALALGLSGTGCLGMMSIPSSSKEVASSNGQPPPVKQVPVSAQGPASSVRQAAYMGENANGQPIYGTPGGVSITPIYNSNADPGPIPTEINRVSLPPWRVAPPDILMIDAARFVPKPPYNIEPLEVLLIKVTSTLPNEPIDGPFTVTPEGTINLGFGYGTVRVQGMTVDQIQDAIRDSLGKTLRNPQVSVSLLAFRGQQQVRGQHLVRPDGTISLGAYGCLYVAGMTLGEVKVALEHHLSEYVVNPQIAVDMYAYNSAWYTVIYDGGGYGQQLYALPITGNETVLSAISRMQGLTPASSIRRIWVARPSPCGHPCDQVLPVDWEAITKGGSTCTNYQLLPGDRVYVDADPLVRLDNMLAKILNPIERLLGVTLLGTTTVQTLQNGTTSGAFIVR